MIGTTLYQIHVTGEWQNFAGENKFVSKKVYLTSPSQEEIDEFIDKCTGKFKSSLYDLNPDTVIVKILELIISE